jgi:hypothetical protein
MPDAFFINQLIKKQLRELSGKLMKLSLMLVDFLGYFLLQ